MNWNLFRDSIALSHMQWKAIFTSYQAPVFDTFPKSVSRTIYINVDSLKTLQV